MATRRSGSIASVFGGVVAAGLALLFAQAMGCSLIVSYDGLVGDGGEGGEGGSHASCPASACVASAPGGWEGPVAFFSGKGAVELPSCDGLSLDLGSGTLDAPAAICTPCKCSPPTGQTCGDGVLTAWAGASCTGGTSDSTETTGSGCQLLESTTGNDYFTSAPVPATGGKCQASGGKVTLPPARFAERIRLCAATAGGCQGGETCFSAPAAYDPKPCIYRMGDVACDVPGFPTKHSAHAGVDDSRACDPCTCGAPSVGTCPAKTDLYDLPGCVTLLNTAHHDGNCTDAGGTQSWEFTITGPPSGATCTASTGGAIGAATPSATVTVCCGS